MKTHGYSNINSRIYITHGNMKRRCLNPTAKEKRNYKNITLCQDWYEFAPFLKWALENGYNDNLTIDRKDNSKGYYPDNCRFVDYSTQNANRGLSPKNKSGYIGVALSSRKGFRATVQWKGKQIMNQHFSSSLDAAKARDCFIVRNKLPHTLNF